MLPIIGAIGAAVDYSRANAIKSSMQAALDGAGLTLARNTQQPGAGSQSAYDAFIANFVRPEVSNVEVASATSAVAGGTMAGIVMFGDRAMPVNTSFKLNGGSSQYLGGAIYLPSAAIEYSGGAATSASCTQIIGNTITFTGNSAVAINCSSYQTKPFSARTVRLAS